MVHAVFTVEVPERVWVGALSRSHPEATFRVLAAFPDDDSGYGLLEVESPAVEDIVAAMRDDAGVRSVETVRRSTDRAVVQFETTDFPLLLTVQRARVPLEFPIEIVDGQVTIELTAPRGRIASFADQLSALDIPHTLDRIYQEVDVEGLLTDTQRELLAAAVEAGYYDTPRAITLTDLAERVEAAPSTVSETLHRVESAVIGAFAAENLETDDEMR